jgi:hypothetical protein
VADFAVAGDLLAEVEYLQDPAHRTQLVVKGQRLSSPDAIDVAAPALARDGEQAFLCWREVELTPLEAETVWRPRCSVSGDGGESWTSIAAPAEDVGPFWSTKLMVSDEGEMLAAYSLNPNGVSAEGAVTEPVEVDLARFDGEAWTVGHAHSGITFPTRADAVLIEGRVSVAVAGSNDDSDARDHRSIYLADVSLEDNLSWRPFTIDAFSSLAPVEGPWRVEHPALHLSPGGQLVLAASGFYEGHSVAILASAFGTDGWGQVSELALPARLEPELGPVWLDDLAVFPVYDAATDTASLCAGNATQPAVCLDSGSDRILHLEVSESTLYALVGREGSSWEIESWSASEFAGR